MKENPGIHTIHTIFRFAYYFIICKICTSMPKGVLESILEFVLESECQALKLLDFSPIIAYNSSNISCFSRKCVDFLLHFTSHEPWHSRGQRFDPAYLHQKSSEILGFRNFFFLSDGRKVPIYHPRLRGWQPSDPNMTQILFCPKTTQFPGFRRLY